MRPLFHSAFLLLIFILLAGEASGSEEGILFKKVTAAGSGCPQGSTDIVLTPDKTAVSVLFSEMMAEVPQYDGDNENDEIDDDNRTPTSRNNPWLAHKACHVVIETDVVEGYQIDEVEVSADFRGATYKDQGTKALFTSRLVEVTGNIENNHRIKNLLGRKVWRSGEAEDDWTITDTKTIPIKSKCKQQQRHNVKFVMRNVIKAMVEKGFRDGDTTAFMSLDTADLSGKLKLKVKTSKCRAGNSGGRVTRPIRNRDDIITRPDRRVRCPRGTQYSPRHKRCMRTGERRGPVRRRR